MNFVHFVALFCCFTCKHYIKCNMSSCGNRQQKCFYFANTLLRRGREAGAFVQYKVFTKKKLKALKGGSKKSFIKNN